MRSIQVGWTSVRASQKPQLQAGGRNAASAVSEAAPQCVALVFLHIPELPPHDRMGALAVSVRQPILRLTISPPTMVSTKKAKWTPWKKPSQPRGGATLPN